MAQIHALIEELDRESATTRKLLERLPEPKLAWKPHTKSMALGQLAWHVSTIPQVLSTMLLKDSHDFSTGSLQPPLPATTREILEGFERALRTAKENLGTLDDGKAMTVFKISMAGRPVLEAPRIAIVRLILLNHLIHHRGQLSVYLRLLDIPVPSIYGPSADENPFK